MKRDKQGLEILKGLIKSGDLKLKVRLKQTKEGTWALGTLTYLGKQVYRTQDPLPTECITNASKNQETHT